MNPFRMGVLKAQLCEHALRAGVVGMHVGEEAFTLHVLVEPPEPCAPDFGGIARASVRLHQAVAEFDAPSIRQAKQPRIADGHSALTIKSGN